MTNLHDRDHAPRVVDRVEDAIWSLPDPVTVAFCQFFATWWSGFVTKG
jgi:hypothetical protein